MAVAATTHPGRGAVPNTRRGPPGFQRLAIVTAAFTYALTVMGAVVRASGSGLGCPDWPTCYGSLIPPPDLAAWIEWTHRSIAAVTSPLIVATTLAAWIWRRRERGILILATLVPVLLAIQIGLGAVVVLLELPEMAVMVHLTFALVILGLLVWIAGLAGPPPRVLPRARAERGGVFRPLVAVTTGVVSALLVAGAYVRATGASWACTGFPQCNGRGILPFGENTLMDVQLVHRLLAYVAVALVGWVVVEAWRTQRHVPALRPAVLALGLTILGQAAIGAVAVSTGVPPLLQALHVAGAAAAWSAMVVVASIAFRTRHADARPGVSRAPAVA